MSALNFGEMSIKDPTGINATIFDIDPDTYNPFNAPNRGSTFQTVGGGVVNQVFGVFTSDITIDIQGTITRDTFTALWTKYINKGKIWQLEDFLGNVFNFIFKAGENSFTASPIRGSCEFMTYTMRLQVCEVVSWFEGSYG